MESRDSLSRYGVLSGENDGAKEGTETCKEMVTNVVRTNLKLGKKKKGKEGTQNTRERGKAVGATDQVRQL